jgi:tRNA(fMet)-specific endonuclease VapC
MNGRLLLDTNAIIALWANEPALLPLLNAASQIFVSSIVLGELYFGARKSTRAEVNVARIDDFVGHTAILPCDAITAKHYGRIRDLLRQRGRPIPDNDLWIAAIAEQYQLTLLTRDDHFKEVEGLLTERW